MIMAPWLHIICIYYPSNSVVSATRKEIGTATETECSCWIQHLHSIICAQCRCHKIWLCGFFFTYLLFDYLRFLSPSCHKLLYAYNTHCSTYTQTIILLAKNHTNMLAHSVALFVRRNGTISDRKKKRTTGIILKQNMNACFIFICAFAPSLRKSPLFTFAWTNSNKGCHSFVCTYTSLTLFTLEKRSENFDFFIRFFVTFSPSHPHKNTPTQYMFKSIFLVEISCVLLLLLSYIWIFLSFLIASSVILEVNHCLRLL